MGSGRESMNNLIIVRGGGDLATGTIYKLYKCGFSVLVLEVENPSAIRRNVAFSEAVYEGQQTVENVTCFRADSLEEAETFLKEGKKFSRHRCASEHNKKFSNLLTYCPICVKILTHSEIEAHLTKSTAHRTVAETVRKRRGCRSRHSGR